MSKRSSRSCSDGLTLVELLVASTVVLAVTAAAIAFAFASRRLVDRDETRLELVETMRVARELLVTDLRQAGERLADDFPAIEIIDGVAGRPDVVIVRRNLIDTVLQVCEDIDPTTAKIAVARSGGRAGCAVLPDDDGDGWPDNLQAWRDERLASGGRLAAYVFDPVTKDGEFFPYVDENAAAVRLFVDGSHTWSRRYAAADAPRLYLLDERRYELADRRLRIVVNGESARALQVVDHLADLQLTAVFRDGRRSDSLARSDRWSSLRAVEIGLRAERELRGSTVERSWRGQVMPRNVLSR